MVHINIFTSARGSMHWLDDAPKRTVCSARCTGCAQTGERRNDARRRPFAPRVRSARRCHCHSRATRAAGNAGYPHVLAVASKLSYEGRLVVPVPPRKKSSPSIDAAAACRSPAAKSTISPEMPTTCSGVG